MSVDLAKPGRAVREYKASTCRCSATPKLARSLKRKDNSLHQRKLAMPEKQLGFQVPICPGYYDALLLSTEPACSAFRVWTSTNLPRSSTRMVSQLRKVLSL